MMSLEAYLHLFYVCFSCYSSPLHQQGHQRFQFSAPEGTDTRAPGLAQLASQGGKNDDIGLFGKLGWAS